MLAERIITGEWIDWTGGPCPLQYGQKFRLKYRDDVASLVDRTADEAWMIPAAWEHMGTSSDIVAYRICG